ncbi:myc box-dependent-interacting protein 1 isoform X1 [Dermacentor albipictus]|uniref:myc box-dependent-interacting protein 1 isoform X1 n=1 Tax=Dermacentor albipictus TaxID=60249 RepID=UPI0031FCC84D
MADSKGGSFTKVVQKHAGRAKERILQNLGRADKTKDEVFEVYLYNFTRQQTAAAKLQKEFKNYVLCIKSLQLASKALMDTLSEIYEQEWVGHEQIPVKAQTLELLWDDYHRKMNDQVMIPLNSYITQFADVRGRIAKRGRKLVDYDKCRHSVESLRNSAKKKDDYKLGKAREELEDAKQMYEVINNELHEELPALYENRIPFLVSNLQTFFTAESTFHAESAQVFSFLVDTMQKLATESERQGTTVGPYPLPNPPRRYSPNRCAPPLRRTHSNRERTTADTNAMSLDSVVVPGPPVRLAAGNCRDTTAQYARVRRHSAHGRPLEKNRRGASFLSLSAATESGGRPVELYLVVRPPKGATEPCSEPSSVSKEADTRPYEEIEFKKGKSNRASDISIKVTETNGQVASPAPLMVSPVRSDPQCVACGTSTRMKCIWLNDAEFSFLRYQPWQCLRCAVNHSFEAAGGCSQAARRNLCIWFTRVTRLKANYTELQCKMLSSAEAARLENEDSALVNSPGYRTTADRNSEAPPRRDEKDYEPVDVGAQMNSDGDRPVGDDLYDIPVGATTTDLPSGVLYRVRATYKYTAEDVDELNFESGEIIRVIEYDDPEEQEEGWLMGIKESTGEKGLFPANFTRPI